jgi:hypothetical protein
MTRKYSSTSIETTLAGTISNSATTITVAAGTGNALMGGVTLAAGNVDQFTIAIDPDTINEEIVFVTAVSTDTLTVVRARAGTTGVTHTAGATVQHVLTSDDLNFYTAGVATANAAIPATIVDAKGDLIAATGADAVTRIAVGTNGQVLKANSATATGLEWGTDNSYSAPTIGSTSIPSGATVTTIAGLTLTSPTINSGTLTTPTISTITNTGTITLPTSTDTLVGRNTTDTLTNKTLTDPKIDLAINAQTGTTYTFVLTDDCKFVTASNASAITVTIPPASSVTYNTGSQLNIIQKGAGQVTFAAGAGVTIRSTAATAAAPKLRAQYSSATAVYEGSDVWYVVGDIV